MRSIIATPEYGLIIRRSAITRVGFTLQAICEIMEQSSPLDMNDDLLSFGPSFGGEAADEFSRRLEAVGLKYVDDFFIFSGEFPEWCGFSVRLMSDI